MRVLEGMEKTAKRSHVLSVCWCQVASASASLSLTTAR